MCDLDLGQKHIGLAIPDNWEQLHQDILRIHLSMVESLPNKEYLI